MTTPTTDDTDAISKFVNCLLVAEVRVVERVTGQRLDGSNDDTDNIAVSTGLAYVAAKRLGFSDFTYDDAQQLTADEQLAVIKAVPTTPPADRPDKVRAILDDPRVRAADVSGE